MIMGTTQLQIQSYLINQRMTWPRHDATYKHESRVLHCIVELLLFIIICSPFMTVSLVRMAWDLAIHNRQSVTTAVLESNCLSCLLRDDLELKDWRVHHVLQRSRYKSRFHHNNDQLYAKIHWRMSRQYWIWHGWIGNDLVDSLAGRTDGVNWWLVGRQEWTAIVRDTAN